jgi:Piwi domain
VRLDEAIDDVERLPIEEVQLEGSKETFARCAASLLGARYQDFSSRLQDASARLTNGPGLISILDQMHQHLRRKNPVGLAGGHRFSIGDRIAVSDTPEYTSVIRLKPAKYCFNRARTKLNNYAWPGLQQFGPFDRESFARRTPRILLICPDKVAGRVGQAIKLFRDGISSLKDSRFDSGFAGVFALVNPEIKTLAVELFGVALNDIAATYRRVIEEHLSRDSKYDAAFTVLLDEHSALPDAINPYLTAKSILLSNGIPVQEAKISTLTKPPESLQYIFQNIATALYAKMGGIPWTVDHGETADDELVIGLGTAELSGSRLETRQRHVGITTVFRGDGNYLLANLSRECRYADYPKVLHDSTLEVLKEIKSRNAWKPGDTVRVVFHAFKPLKNVEVAQIIKFCVEEVGSGQNVEFAFLTVSHDHPFVLLDLAQSGISPRYGRGDRKGVYVPDRGLVVQLGKYTRLLCANGPQMMKRAALPQPTPLLLHLHKLSTYRDFPYLADQILKFTALSWRSTLPTDRPVTIQYSSLIAGLLARLQSIPDWSPAPLNTKLKTSKWFL